MENRKHPLIIYTVAENVDRKFGFQKERVKLWLPVPNADISLKREVKRKSERIMEERNEPGGLFGIGFRLCMVISW